jgi:hypothetical protein
MPKPWTVPMGVGLVVILVLSQAGDANACLYEGLDPFEVDPTLADVDQEPPAAIEGVRVAISRGRGPERHGCQSRATSCDDIGRWRLYFRPPVDDQSGPDDLGYVVELVSGRVPGQPELEPGDLITDAVGPSYGSTPEEATLAFDWIDGATDKQESLSFTVVVRAVDRAGNLGDASDPVRVRHAGDSGCAMGRGRTTFGGLMMAFALGGLALRRGARESRAFG